jgi:bacterial/archaeal transporter family-2 protein
MSSLMNPLAIIAALIAGTLVAVQSRLNGELGLAIGDGVGAALYSFTSGWILIALVTVFSRTGRAGLRRILELLKTKQLPLWMVFGGAFGGFLVMTQGLAAGTLGIALFTVAVVAGQGISGILIDSRGWLGVEKRRLDTARLLGAVIVLVGVAMVAENPRLETLALLTLPFLAGLGLGYQQASNGKVRISSESAIAATFLNFAMGSGMLFIAKLISLPFVGIPTSFPPQWWLYVGGFAGVVFIAIQVIVVGRIGVLGLGVLLGTGQILGSLLIDLLFPLPGQVITLIHIIGVLVTLAGALLVNLKR